jgi:alpha-mannosidase
MSVTNPSNGTIFCVSTSHMDWDWIATFEQYYNTGYYNSNPDDEHPPVRSILDQAMALLDPTQDTGYQFNLAEVSWLQRYMLDNPSIPPTANMKGLFFLGGGFTSPDNLVCNGEAFIRNYLVGRSIIRKMGLSSCISNVCWIPDDFGHDPQLPVVLKAMNMTGVSFWRIPGNEPSASFKPIDGSDSLALQLTKSGITFNWQAADGSTIIAQQMVNGYGVIWDQSSGTGQNLADFVNYTNLDGESGNIPYIAPGNLYMAPCGGDFSPASATLQDAINDYNNDSKNANMPYAKLGTFQDYIDALNEQNVQLETIKYFDSSNFWTGHFSSRVQLKINQQRTVNRLMAAETLLTLLQLQSTLSPTVMNGLQLTINAIWENVVPSTHHDYVNGTSSDAIKGYQGNVYLTEQLPLSESALNQSVAVLSDAIELLGTMVTAAPADDEIPYVVFNPTGCKRAGVGNLVVIPDTVFNTYRLSGSTEYHDVQTLQNGDIVFPYNGLQSTGYGCAYLSISSVPLPEPPDDQSPIVMNNGVIQVTLDQDKGWAISSMIDLSTNTELVASGSHCNLLTVYYENTMGKYPQVQGNIYQMGNEPPTTTSGSGINVDGFFADDTSQFIGLEGELTESGPYLWHFVGTAYNKQNDLMMVVEYMLEIDEPMVRMQVTGQASTEENEENAVSIVTVWQFADAPAALNYGTGNHWNGGNYTPYWYGPTFRATHDYVLGVDEDNNPLGAIYHEAVRAWSLTEGTLLGILLRNSPNTNRGAAGYDTDVHAQNYAFRLPGVQGADSCQPLQESMAFQQPLLVALATGNSMPETGLLASLQQDNGIIRVARTQLGSGGVPTNTSPVLAGLPFSFVLRLYQPTNNTSDTWNLNIQLPATPVVSLVSALEEALDDAQEPAYSDGVITIPAMDTLATVRVQTVGVKPVQ